MGLLRAGSQESQTQLAQTIMSGPPRTGELLLSWMSHMRTGSWFSFLRALEALEGQTSASPPSPTQVRVRLEELAHAEFFVGGSNRWRTLAPLLAGLPVSNSAVLVGARTPQLLQRLALSAENSGCGIQIVDGWPGPDRVRMLGTPRAITAAAREADVPYIDELAAKLAATVEPVRSVLMRAAPTAAPINWSVRSFDLSGLGWVDALLADTAYEYRSRHGQRMYCVRVKHRLLQLDRRYAVYAAANLHHVPLISYNEDSETLTIPRTAPLPVAMQRTAAMCSGTPATNEDGSLSYSEVPSEIARLLIAAVGQRLPQFRWLTLDRRGA